KSWKVQWSANRSAKLVDVELRLAQTNERRRGVVEERRSVQRAVAEEVEKISVILVRTGFTDQGDDAAGVTTEISGECTRQNTKFLKRIRTESLNRVGNVDGEVVTVS